jgi:hypothetical protein
VHSFSRLIVYILIAVFCSSCAFPKWETKIEEKDSGTQKTFNKDLPLKSHKVIHFAGVNDAGIMTVTTKTISLFDEIEAPIVRRVAKEKRAPDPIGAVLVTGLTFGLNLLFATSETWKILTGDSKNERDIGASVDVSRGKKTGKQIWAENVGGQSGPVVVQGLLDAPLTIFGSNSNQYDLTPFIKAYQGEEASIPIFITCLECADDIPERPGVANKTRVDINIGRLKRNSY